MTTCTSLAELQRAFAALDEAASDLVQGCIGMQPRDGMLIYSNMFLWRQVDSLLEDFPKLAAVSGDGFYDLCQAYLRAHPSRHHSLARLGSSLASYLTTHPARRADLKDLAALEWARCEVFEEADAPTLASLQAADVECGLALVPALRVLWVEHDVTSVWKAVEEGRPVPEPTRAPSCIVVWRKGFDIFHVRIEPLEAAALERAAAGGTLAEVCETFAEQPEPLAAASRAIGSWLNEGWIAQGDL